MNGMELNEGREEIRVKWKRVGWMDICERDSSGVVRNEKSTRENIPLVVPNL